VLLKDEAVRISNHELGRPLKWRGKVQQSKTTRDITLGMFWQISRASVFVACLFTTPALADRIRNPTAVFSGLDKITGRIISFEVAINETVQFGALQLTPKVCWSRPPTEAPQTTTFLEVDEVTLTNEYRRIFTGWMFASSPGLHGVEHPIYDVWLTDCKGGTEIVAEPKEPANPLFEPPSEKSDRKRDGQQGAGEGARDGLPLRQGVSPQSAPTASQPSRRFFPNNSTPADPAGGNR
jgi:hypothetical protein